MPSRFVRALVIAGAAALAGAWLASAGPVNPPEGSVGPSGPSLADLERQFRADTSDVKVHTGGAATAAASALTASGVAIGNEVALGSSIDVRSAAHEVTHVVQQGAGTRVAPETVGLIRLIKRAGVDSALLTQAFVACEPMTLTIVWTEADGTETLRWVADGAVVRKIRTLTWQTPGAPAGDTGQMHMAEEYTFSYDALTVLTPDGTEATIVSSGTG
jgi:hypothetical protein